MVYKVTASRVHGNQLVLANCLNRTTARLLRMCLPACEAGKSYVQGRLVHLGHGLAWVLRETPKQINSDINARIKKEATQQVTPQ